jgi:hypothetical protein
LGPFQRRDHLRHLRILALPVVLALVAAGGTPNADQTATTVTTPDQLDAASDHHNQHELA